MAFFPHIEQFALNMQKTPLILPRHSWANVVKIGLVNRHSYYLWPQHHWYSILGWNKRAKITCNSLCCHLHVASAGFWQILYRNMLELHLLSPFFEIFLRDLPLHWPISHKVRAQLWKEPSTCIWRTELAKRSWLWSRLNHCTKNGAQVLSCYLFLYWFVHYLWSFTTVYNKYSLVLRLVSTCHHFYSAVKQKWSLMGLEYLQFYVPATPHMAAHGTAIGAAHFTQILKVLWIPVYQPQCWVVHLYISACCCHHHIYK